MGKRLLSLLLAAALCLSLCPAALAAESFRDVEAGAWFYDDVMRAADLGLLTGRDGGYFAPDDQMTEAEALTLAVRLYRTLTGSQDALPERQPEEAWYGPYVRYAAGVGIADERGGSPEFFNSAATRRSYVRLFYRALPDDCLYPINSIPDGAIPDVPMDDVAAEAIYDFYRAGILTGSDAHGYFNPDAYIRRAEVAAILVRITDSGARKHFVLGGDWSALSIACADADAFCAVAYLGSEGDPASVLECYREDLAFFLEDAVVADCGGKESYLFLPAASASLTVSEWIYDGEHIDGAKGKTLAACDSRQAVIVRCNPDAFSLNALVEVSDSSGLLMSYQPCISLADGRIKLPEDGGLYDYTRYGEG